MPYMKVVIDALKEKGLRDDYIVMVGGAPLNEEFGEAVGADAYCRDAAEAAQTVDQHIDRGCDSALVIDGNDRFNIAYQSRDDSKMKLATDNSGSWNIYVADAGEHPNHFPAE